MKRLTRRLSNQAHRGWKPFARNAAVVRDDAWLTSRASETMAANATTAVMLNPNANERLASGGVETAKIRTPQRQPGEAQSITSAKAKSDWS
jgi:hypothetical protein